MKKVFGLIPAAGKGERLHPLTDTIPKPMIKIKGKPLIQYAIEHLRSMDIAEIVIALHYKKEEIKKFLDSKDFDATLHYCYPDQLLGLAYTVYSARDFLKGTFVTHLADNIFTENCKYALERHIKNDAEATLVIERGEPEGRYETIRLNRNIVTDIIEKADISYGYRGTGIYIFEPQIFEYCAKIRESERGELELQDVIKNMILDRRKVLGILVKGVRMEITTAKDINKAELYIESMEQKK